MKFFSITYKLLFTFAGFLVIIPLCNAVLTSYVINRRDVLIHDLLAFSRMGRSEMATRSVDLASLVREVIQGLESETADQETVITKEQSQ